MSLTVRCEGCGRRFRANDKLAGKSTISAGPNQDCCPAAELVTPPKGQSGERSRLCDAYSSTA